MNKTIKQLILMAALAMAWGCSSSGDDDIANENGGDSPSSQFTATMIKTEKEPDWQIDLTMDDEAPEWTAPDASNFESSMTVLVKLSEPLVPYSTDDDRMAIFVNDECRAVSVRNMNVLESYKEVFFVLNIRGTASNENADEYVLKYYSGGAHHLFTISDPNAARAFVSEYIRTDFETDMLYGNHKYPVKVLANIMLISSFLWVSFSFSFFWFIFSFSFPIFFFIFFPFFLILFIIIFSILSFSFFRIIFSFFFIIFILISFTIFSFIIFFFYFIIFLIYFIYFFYIFFYIYFFVFQYNF